MLKLINLSDRHPYSLEEDTGDDPTIWKLSALPSRVVAHIRDRAQHLTATDNSEGGRDLAAALAPHEAAREMVRFGLKEVESLDGGDGPIILKLESTMFKGKKYEVVPDSFLDRLPMPWMMELGSKIQTLATFTPEEEKNSEASSPVGD